VPYVALKPLIKASRRPDEPPVRVPPGPGQQALKKEIEGEDADAHFSTWDKRQVLVVQAQLPGRDSVYGYGFRFSDSAYVLFAGDELHVAARFGEEGVPLTGAPHLRRLLAAVREVLLAQRKQQQKRDKLRKLKERSIETQVDAIAARMRFAYVLEPMHKKVKLTVRLNARSGLEVDIPHGRIQETLAELPKLIGEVRAIYGPDATFKVVATAHVRHFREPGPA
jgi:hypothetical protein